MARINLLPTLSVDGGKMVLLDEVNPEVKNEMLKLKLQQAKEIKSILKREARFYKITFALCLGLIMYVLAIT